MPIAEKINKIGKRVEKNAQKKRDFHDGTGNNGG